MTTRRFDGQTVVLVGGGPRYPMLESMHIQTGPSNGQVLASLGLSATIEATVATEAELLSTIRAEDFSGTIEADIAASLTGSLGIEAEIAVDHSVGLVSLTASLGLDATITGAVAHEASMTASLGIGLVGDTDGTPMVLVRVAGAVDASLGIALVSDGYVATDLNTAAVTASLELGATITTGVTVAGETTASLGIGGVLEASNADHKPSVEASLGLSSVITAELGPAPYVYVPSAGTGARTRTRFRPLGPRVKLNEIAEDLWVQDAEIVAPPPPLAAPPPMARAGPSRALPQDVPMLARPQTGPVSFQPPPTPGQVANEFLATLDQLAREAGLDESVIADLQDLDAIDVSDVFNDMR